MSSTQIETLIKLLSKLPGLGPRSARRGVLHLINHRENVLLPLIDALTTAANTITVCSTCGNVDTQNPCHICQDTRRIPSQICVVEEVADLWAIERSAMFRGMYHVLGGTLSAIDGRGPEDLTITQLLERAANGNVAEIIMATNATVDGQTTAHYITERLKPLNIAITRIAHGIPVGGELDYLDDGTLGAALRARRAVE